MSALRKPLVLVAVALGVGACGALQGLDKYEKCDTDESCGLTAEAGATDTRQPDKDATGPLPDGAGQDAGCADTTNDPSNCGRCGNVCPAGFECSGSVCACAKTTCGGADGGADGGALRCVDVQTDVASCGGCDLPCALPNAVPKCAAGACAVASCGPGFVDCDGLPANGCECASDSCLPGKLCGKRVFTTSIAYEGNLGGLAGADAKCTGLAGAAGLPGSYKAWLSDGVTSPNTRFTKATIPYRLVDGTLVANSYADLVDGTIAAPLNKPEAGGAPPAGTFCGPGKLPVWSSTNSVGDLIGATSNCTNWTNSTVGGAQWGDGSMTTADWATFCYGGTCGGVTFVAPIYCFQQ
jgi:hypothetical protein